MIKTFPAETSINNAFGSAIKAYTKIVDFLKASQTYVDNFVKAIPNDANENIIAFWNDCGVKPAMRIEFEIRKTLRDGNKVNKFLVYQVKQKKDGSLEFIVDRTKKFKDEVQALKVVTDTYNEHRKTLATLK